MNDYADVDIVDILSTHHKDKFGNKRIQQKID